MDRRTLLLAGFGALILPALPARARDQARRDKIEAAAKPALARLLSENRLAKRLSKKAHATLIFPEIVKVGLLIGGGAGDGVLKVRGKTAAYYETGGLSIGAQIGVQSYGYVLMFMTKESLAKFQNKSGFALGGDASVLIADSGGSDAPDTVNTDVDIVAFIFDQQGAMLKLSLSGTKYTKLDI